MKLEKKEQNQRDNLAAEKVGLVDESNVEKMTPGMAWFHSELLPIE